ncbi:hypothetical protein [Catellatospora sp. NPDC049609]|uniref:hypothetical protein n=1 Tax=Catellatospora sp. NPDC049609 TaxID=3155505 RepID=UPI003439BC37
MYQFEADIVPLGGMPDPAADAGALPGAEPRCDGCGQPVPCPAVAHAVQRELAADFARGYSGL